MFLRCTSNIVCKIFLWLSLAFPFLGLLPLLLQEWPALHPTPPLLLSLIQDSSMDPSGSQWSIIRGLASCGMWAKQAGYRGPSASRPLSFLLRSHLFLCHPTLSFITFQVTWGLFLQVFLDSQQTQGLPELGLQDHDTL